MKNHEIIRISFNYEINGGTVKTEQFIPVSYSLLKNGQISFGLPSRVHRSLFTRKTFKLISVNPFVWDGRQMTYTGMGTSVDKCSLYLHFRFDKKTVDVLKDEYDRLQGLLLDSTDKIKESNYCKKVMELLDKTIFLVEKLGEGGV